MVRRSDTSNIPVLKLSSPASIIEPKNKRKLGIDGDEDLNAGWFRSQTPLRARKDLAIGTRVVFGSREVPEAQVFESVMRRFGSDEAFANTIALICHLGNEEVMADYVAAKGAKNAPLNITFAKNQRTAEEALVVSVLDLVPPPTHRLLANALLAKGMDLEPFATRSDEEQAEVYARTRFQVFEHLVGIFFAREVVEDYDRPCRRIVPRTGDMLLTKGVARLKDVVLEPKREESTEHIHRTLVGADRAEYGFEKFFRIFSLSSEQELKLLARLADVTTREGRGHYGGLFPPYRLRGFQWSATNALDEAAIVVPFEMPPDLPVDLDNASFIARFFLAPNRVTEGEVCAFFDHRYSDAGKGRDRWHTLIIEAGLSEAMLGKPEYYHLIDLDALELESGMPRPGVEHLPLERRVARAREFLKRYGKTSVEYHSYFHAAFPGEDGETEAKIAWLPLPLSKGKSARK